MRLRRLKWSLIRARGFKALEDFLGENLDYDLYSENFADDLAKILQDNLPEDQVNSAQTLALSVPRMKRTLSIRSKRFSTAED